ncbi:hypothetical protein [Ohtaekwangia sp.]|uniref:hypothetical protein n=1 Tax=Ohtaekwangia sp. TaxID=2066019 RepID=UPI002F949787
MTPEKEKDEPVQTPDPPQIMNPNSHEEREQKKGASPPPATHKTNKKSGSKK